MSDQTLSNNVQILTKRYLTSKDAYITGYFFATIDSVPPHFVSFMRDNYEGGWDEFKIIQTFTSMTADVTIPQETLKVTSFPSRGGMSRSGPLYSQHGNSVSISFLVDQKMETTSLLSGWYNYVTLMADGRLPQTGLNYSSNLFGANFYYCTLLPNMQDAVFAFAAESFWPTTNITQDFSHNLTSVDSLRHSVTFNIDYRDYWTNGRKDTRWIKTLLETKIKEYSQDLAKLANSNNSSMDYTMSPGKMNGDRTVKNFGRIEEDRYGNTPRKRTNDGSVRDKFNEPPSYTVG